MCRASSLQGSLAFHFLCPHVPRQRRQGTACLFRSQPVWGEESSRTPSCCSCRWQVGLPPFLPLHTEPWRLRGPSLSPQPFPLPAPGPGHRTLLRTPARLACTPASPLWLCPSWTVCSPGSDPTLPRCLPIGLGLLSPPHPSVSSCPARSRCSDVLKR